MHFVLKYINQIILSLCCLFSFFVQSHIFVRSGDQHTKMPLLLGIIGEKNDELLKIGHIIKNDLGFSGQFSIDIDYFKKNPSKKVVKTLFDKGYLLSLFINRTDKGVAIEWRIYDTAQGTMVQGKKYEKKGNCSRGWGHNITDLLWPILTGQQGCFSSKIAYCKETMTKTGRLIRHIYVADYDGNNEQMIVDSPTINIAPRWNMDMNNPLLFYSEHTNTNVRLMVVNTKKKSRIVSNFSGINMLPAFSQDGKAVVYCVSRGDGSCQLYRYENNQLKRLTNNSGNNISPSFADNDMNVYFCSDFQTGKPQIYVYDFKKNRLQRITNDGYCTSPHYCPKTGKLVYTKMVSGTMQLYIYDTKSKKHTQLTADAGNKQECSWSPCGNYILFAMDYAEKSRIALLNILTQERRFLTKAHKSCTYPAWSPCYQKFPVFTD